MAKKLKRDFFRLKSFPASTSPTSGSRRTRTSPSRRSTAGSTASRCRFCESVSAEIYGQKHNWVKFKFVDITFWGLYYLSIENFKVPFINKHIYYLSIENFNVFVYEWKFV
jgi:hypothetical protein